MLEDYFTKKLQGKLFQSFRDVVMGYTHIKNLLLDEELLRKESIEKLNIVIKDSNLNKKRTHLE